MVEFDRWVVRARALAQTHPFTPRSYRYVNGVVDHERQHQPSPEMGVWAGQALMAGYCLRRVEEQDGPDGQGPGAAAAASLPASLDAAASHVAELLRTEGAEPYLMSREEQVVEALDRLIEGEVERRLGDWAEGERLDEDMRAELEEYLAAWTIKGYALRVVDQLLPDDAAQRLEPDADGGP